MTPPVLVKIEKSTKVQVGDRVQIVNLDRRFMGGLVHNYVQKYVGKLAVIAKIIPSKKFNICIQPNGFSSYLMVTESEIKLF